MNAEPLALLQALSAQMKPIFLKWERLRIPYNLWLAGVLYLSHGASMGAAFFRPIPMLLWLLGAVLANVCFLAAPLAESYITWLGLQMPRTTTALLFVGGALVSIPCVLLFVAAFPAVFPPPGPLLP